MEEQEPIPPPAQANQPDSSSDVNLSQKSHPSLPCLSTTQDNHQDKKEKEERPTKKDEEGSKERKDRTERREQEENREEAKEDEMEVRIVGQVKGREEERRGEKRFLWQAGRFEDPETETRRQLVIRA